MKRSRHRYTSAPPPVAEGLKLARGAGAGAGAGGTRSRGAERTNTNLIAARVCGRGYSSRCRHGSRRRCAAGANLSPSRGREGYALLLSIGRSTRGLIHRDARKSTRVAWVTGRIWQLAHGGQRFFSLDTRVTIVLCVTVRDDGDLWITIIGRQSGRRRVTVRDRREEGHGEGERKRLSTATQ